jgi:hypothetical protein
MICLLDEVAVSVPLSEFFYDNFITRTGMRASYESMLKAGETEFS